MAQTILYLSIDVPLLAFVHYCSPLKGCPSKLEHCILFQVSWFPVVPVIQGRLISAEFATYGSPCA